MFRNSVRRPRKPLTSLQYLLGRKSVPPYSGGFSILTVELIYDSKYILDLASIALCNIVVFHHEYISIFQEKLRQSVTDFRRGQRGVRFQANNTMFR
jgi:hypothetical protein